MDVVSNVRRWTVPKESELRLESNTDTAPLFVTLLGKSGATAEIFGSEMGPNRKYAVYRGRCAVFTWTGCEVSVFFPRLCVLAHRRGSQGGGGG